MPPARALVNRTTLARASAQRLQSPTQEGAFAYGSTAGRPSTGSTPRNSSLQGHFGLQVRGATTHLQVRKLEMQELGRPPARPGSR